MSKKVGVGIGVFVIREDGFFVKGKRQNAHGHGSWSVPGGWLEFGESWEEAAIREVAEVTGLKIKEPIIHVATTNNIFEDENMHSNTIWLKTKYIDGEPTILEPDIFVEQGWFTLETLPEPLFSPWDDLLKLDLNLVV